MAFSCIFPEVTGLARSRFVWATLPIESNRADTEEPFEEKFVSDHVCDIKFGTDGKLDESIGSFIVIFTTKIFCEAVICGAIFFELVLRLILISSTKTVK